MITRTFAVRNNDYELIKYLAKKKRIKVSQFISNLIKDKAEKN